MTSRENDLLYENVHPSLALVLLFQRTKCNAGKVYILREETYEETSCFTACVRASLASPVYCIVMQISQVNRYFFSLLVKLNCERLAQTRKIFADVISKMLSVLLMCILNYLSFGMMFF